VIRFDFNHVAKTIIEQIKMIMPRLSNVTKSDLKFPQGPARPSDAPKVAVIGSGISGLSAAWLLSSSCQVTLFEAEARTGGHSNTVQVDTKNGPLPVDTGFIVYNEHTYPNLTALFRHLDVATEASDMSFSVSAERSNFSYAGHPTGVAAEWRTLCQPRFWRMAAGVIRFYRQARRDVSKETFAGCSLGDYVKARRFSATFVDDHLLPMAAAIWSAPLNVMLDYPLESFVRFCENHGLLQMRNRPQWRTVAGGSRVYVEKLLGAAKPELQLSRPVRQVERGELGAWVTDAEGQRTQYDDVVLAVHADQALKLLAHPSDIDRQLLEAIPYQANQAVLHRDTSFMPARRQTWASWNYLAGQDGDGPVCVTYWMNRLQNLPANEDIFVTLNPKREVKQIIRAFDYSHPLFDRGSTAAQKALWQLQGQGRIWFCGAYFGAGFHEDGLQSGLAVAEAIGGVRRPWQVPNESGRIHLTPTEQPRLISIGTMKPVTSVIGVTP
jgi:predicted NAD/FAD-binding protein